MQSGEMGFINSVSGVDPHYGWSFFIWVRLDVAAKYLHKGAEQGRNNDTEN